MNTKILLISFFSLFGMGFITSKGQDQISDYFNYFSVSFDTTQASAPMVISGQLKNFQGLNGVFIKLSNSQDTTQIIFNDTLMFVGQNGLYKTDLNGQKRPFRGLNFSYDVLINNSFSGLLYCDLWLLNINGSVTRIRRYSVKK